MEMWLGVYKDSRWESGIWGVSGEEMRKRNREK